MKTAITTLVFASLLTGSGRAALIAHYDFDTDLLNGSTRYTNEVTTAGTNFAVAGARGTFNQKARRLGTGCLVLANPSGSWTDTSGGDGAVSNNSFSWTTSDVRTIAFWVKAAPTAQQDSSATMISLGSGTATGARFDIRLASGYLRLELQGGGFTSAAAAAKIDDNVWHHVAVVVPNTTSTLANVKYYIDGNVTGTMSGTTAINTAGGPLRMGDSFQDSSRDFTGSLDDVRVYNDALDDAAVMALYNDGVANLPAILNFQISPTSMLSGGIATLTYEIDPAATSADIDNGVGAVSGSGTATVYPSSTTTYTLTVVRASVTTQQTATITVAPPALPPVVNYLHTTPSVVRNGGTVRVHWSTTYADVVTLDDGTGPVSVSGTGSRDYTVGADTTFTLSATNTTLGGSPATATDFVDVRSDPDPVSYGETVLADNPIAFYRFEEPSGCPILFDHATAHKDSTQLLGSLQFNQTGAVGKAGRFNGAEAAVLSLAFNPQDPDGDDTTGDVDPDNKEAWTVELLVRPTTSAGSNLVSNRDASGTGRSDLLIASTGSIGSFFGAATQDSGTKALTSMWSHVVMVVAYDSATSKYKLRYHVNGTLVSTVTGVTVESSLGAWVLGSHKTQQAGTFLTGLMDEVSFYNYALDDPDGDGDQADSKVPAHFAAYIQDGAALLSFGARASTVHAGSSGSLQVIVGASAFSVSLDNGIGAVTPVNGVATVTVNPESTTTYVLTVMDALGSYNANATVTVIGPVSTSGAGFNASNQFGCSATNLIPGWDYQWVRTTNLADWDTVAGGASVLIPFSAATTGPVSLLDVNPPAGHAFYRLVEKSVP